MPMIDTQPGPSVGPMEAWYMREIALPFSQRGDVRAFARQQDERVAALVAALEAIEKRTARNIELTISPADLETFADFNSTIWNLARTALAATEAVREAAIAYGDARVAGELRETPLVTTTDTGMRQRTPQRARR